MDLKQACREIVTTPCGHDDDEILVCEQCGTQRILSLAQRIQGEADAAEAQCARLIARQERYADEAVAALRGIMRVGKGGAHIRADEAEIAVRGAILRATPPAEGGA